MERNLLERKRILVVDCEPETLDTVAEVLSASEVVTVGNADEARPLIAKDFFDLAILDTVGANGCDLLRDCHANKLLAALLTARIVEVRRLNMAMKLGAMSFFCKDELHRLPESVAELFERMEKGKPYSTKLFPRIRAAFRGLRRVVCEEADRDRTSKLPRISW